MEAIRYKDLICLVPGYLQRQVVRHICGKLKIKISEISCLIDSCEC